VNSSVGRQFVVLGNCPAGKALQSVLTRICTKWSIQTAADDETAKYLLWDAGDSPTRRDTTHLIVVTPSRIPMTPNRLFKTHCRLRPGDAQTATLLGPGPGWSGAILFVGWAGEGRNQLTQLPPFSQIEVGHAVVTIPLKLPDLLHKMANLEPLYPEKWKQALLKIEGLASFKQLLHEVETSTAEPAQSLQYLADALDQLLADKLLDKLLEHREVIGAMRELRNTLGGLPTASPSDVKNAVVKVRQIMRDYFL
jgi:hypothetical protein